MIFKLKAALDSIHAEDELKSGTIEFLYTQIQNRKKPRRRVIAKYVAALACSAVVFFSGLLAYTAYITPVAYLDVDVNPSIELALNRFDRVIGAYAYNEDGETVLSGVSIKHKNFDEAVVTIMDAIAARGYLKNDGLVSVTLQTSDTRRETELLTNVQTDLENYMTDHHQSVKLDVFPVSGDVRSSSHDQGVSPAKYLAIQELIEVDPSASVDNCRNHSISEIKQFTKEHTAHHNATENNETTSGAEPENYTDSTPEPSSDTNHNEHKTEEPIPSQNTGHHGNGNSNGHRGH